MFTPPDIWVSDQGSHFINVTLQVLSRYHHIGHRPTVSYCPWTNGTVLRLNCDILCSMCSMLAQLKLCHQGWMVFISNITSVFNKALLPRLGSILYGTLRSPLPVMTKILLSVLSCRSYLMRKHLASLLCLRISISMRGR